ncbi:hypothetical protein ANCCAN_00543 [Ancylostoma caninum]|uniref:Copine C-terminal domain-containing protein n=1 Tax=Ancylostoma caninum TaxID=29170 RepID=A0A368HDQ5_ANCCA|nr:hypothetical protein ANCCAN_00543 [Ancylostoma caninum]
MDELDSDDSLLAFEGRQAQRDIVQFVPLRQFLQGPVTGMEDNNSELEMSFTSSPLDSDRSHPYPTAPPVA